MLNYINNLVGVNMYNKEEIKNSILKNFNSYEDFKIFYKTHKVKDIELLLGVNNRYIKKFCNEINLDVSKSKEDLVFIHNKSLIEKYGSLEAAYNKQKETRNKTMLNKYGVDNIMKLEEERW